MATSNQSPNGFSYAQAAKGKAVAATSQTPSSKVTSGTATPATGTFSELAPSSNWADDVEATEGEKSVESRMPDEEQKDVKEPKEAKEHSQAAPARDSAVERTKSESRAQNASSGVSSPELAAASSTTNTDDSSSVPNGTSPSDTTWETKSQNSEPAWIAERKERQTTGHAEDSTSPVPATGSGPTKRGKKEAKEPKEPALTQLPQKPVVLHEAPPPQVNIWAKRLEDAKIKTVVPQTPKPATPTSQPAQVKENVRPKTEPRKKANSIASAPREVEHHALDSKKTNGVQAKRTANEPRTAVRQGAKPATETARADPSNAAAGRAAQREAQSLPNLTSVMPPLVKDETSWPTPDSAPEKERKAAAAAASEKESEDADVDAGVAGKSRDKTKWTPLPVTPTIVWQTEEMNRPRNQTGERGARSNTTARGRGGLRGAPSGSKGGERAAAKTAGAQGEAENVATGRGGSGTVDRETMPPPARPSAASVLREVNGSFQESQSGPATVESPSKADFDRQETKNSEQSQHHTSHDVRLEATRDGLDTPREIPTKKGSFENKEKSRSNYDSFGTNGKEYGGRGKTRGGRGRGGSREFANGHQPSASFANSHTEFGTATFGIPASPSSYHSPRASHAYGFAQPGRGGWARGGNPRSQSIPVEQIYGRSFGSQGPLVQTYYPGMYEYPSPMAPVPFAPMMDPQYVVDMVSTQLEYYFSLDNLLKDVFLRKNMDSQGFVFLDVIAGFNRLKQLTTDKDMIKFVSLKSESIEIRVGDDGKDRLRRSESWEQFILPMDQREVGAQTDGPQAHHRPEPIQLPYWPGHSMTAFRGPPSTGLQGPRSSHDSSFAMNGGVVQFAPMSTLGDSPYGSFINGEEHRGRAAKSPIQDNNASPSLHTFVAVDASRNLEADVFPDENISSLTVVVKMNQPRAAPHHNVASRTFSNGSIDTRSVYSGMDKEKSAEDQIPPVTNGEPLTNGDKAHTTPSRHASPSLGRSPEKTDAASESIILWVKDKDIPQGSLPPGAAHEPYMQLRTKALDQRDQAATGACPYDLEVLYQFWSHFLIRNFNNKMYSEFQMFANDDAHKRHSVTGLQNLVQYYAKALASTNHPMRDHVLKDYVELVKNEPSILNGQAHKQLRQAWRNGALNLKIRKKLADILDDGTKQSLEA